MTWFYCKLDDQRRRSPRVLTNPLPKGIVEKEGKFYKTQEDGTLLELKSRKIDPKKFFKEEYWLLLEMINGIGM